MSVPPIDTLPEKVAFVPVILFANVETPATNKLLPRVVNPTKVDVPFTSMFAFISTLPPYVDIPDTSKVVRSVGPILNLSVPVPTVPFISLLTNSYQLPPCAKKP